MRLGRWAIASALIVHVVLVVSIARQPFDVNVGSPAQRSLIWSLHNDTVHRAGPGVDFFGIYQAGLQVRAGRSPYRGVVGPSPLPYAYPYRYLPIVAETFGRVALLASPRVAYLGWLSVLEMTLLLLCAGLLRRAPSLWLRWVGPCILLLSSPYLLELHMGQFSFMTAALLVVALVLCAPGIPGRGPTWLAAASYVGSVLLRFSRSLCSLRCCAMAEAGAARPLRSGPCSSRRSRSS